MFRLIQLIITVLIALSVLRSLLSFVQRFLAGAQARTPAGPARQSSPAMLYQDPVCGTYVSMESSLKRIVGGHVFHFCSPECRDRYTA